MNNQTIAAVEPNAIVGLTEQETSLAIADNFDSLRAEYLEVSAIKTIGEHFKFMSQSATSELFYSICPLVRKHDDVQSLFTTSASGSSIVPITRLERGNPLVWQLTLHDFNKVSGDNGEIAFDTLSYQQFKLYFVEDMSAGRMQLLHIDFKNEAITGNYSDKESKCIRKLGMDNLCAHALNARNLWVKLVSNGNVLNRRDSMFNEHNPIAQAYKEAQRNKRL